MINCKTILISLLLFASCLQGATQDLTLGIKVGPNISTIGGDSEGVAFKPGFQIGLFSHMNLSETLSIRPELLLSDQGTKFKKDGRADYWYINFPVLLHYQNSKFMLNIGPQIATLAGAKLIVDGKKESIVAELKNIDFSLVAGIGFLLSDRFALEGRFNFGLSDTSNTIYNEGDHLYNRSLQLSLEYQLRKRR